MGDRVQINVNAEGTAFITEIEDRKNYIIRRSSNLSKQSHIIAANLDQCILVVTVNYPETSTVFIDRFLASAEAYRVPVCLVFQQGRPLYGRRTALLGWLDKLIHAHRLPVLPDFCLGRYGSRRNQTGIRRKSNLIFRPFRCGKIHLINAILPEQNVKTGEISTAHNKGMHTTTFSEMFPVASDGYIIDTPGIKGFGTFDMKDEEVGHYFKEIFEFSAQCKYGNCTHRHEPGCAVREAVENHYISESRYASYLNILEDKEEGKYRSAY